MKAEAMHDNSRRVLITLLHNSVRLLTAWIWVVLVTLTAFAQQQPATLPSGQASNSSTKMSGPSLSATTMGEGQVTSGQRSASSLNSGSMKSLPTSACLEAKPSNGESVSVPDYETYRFFFRQVGSLEDLATAVDRSGKDGSGWRRYMKVTLGLSDDEAKGLRGVALEFNQALKEHEANLAPIRATIAAKRSLGDERPDLSEMAEWNDQMIAIVTSHINQLRASLGESTFQKLDAYVQSCYKPQTVVPSAAQPAGVQSQKNIEAIQ